MVCVECKYDTHIHILKKWPDFNLVTLSENGFEFAAAVILFELSFKKRQSIVVASLVQMSLHFSPFQVKMAWKIVIWHFQSNLLWQSLKMLCILFCVEIPIFFLLIKTKKEWMVSKYQFSYPSTSITDGLSNQNHSWPFRI